MEDHEVRYAHDFLKELDPEYVKSILKVGLGSDDENLIS